MLIEGNPPELRASAGRVEGQPALTPSWTGALPATGDPDADGALYEIHCALAAHGQALAVLYGQIGDLLQGYAMGFETADAPLASGDGGGPTP